MDDLMQDLIKNSIALVVIGAWVTSIIVCIQHSMWALLFADLFVPPVAIIHGIGSWFGVF